MKIHAVLIVGLGLIATGCSEREQAGSEPAVDAAMPEAAAPWERDVNWRNSEFMKHMHLHAERLDELNFALADGDLDAAKTPANWLATHETYADVQSDWLPYLYNMRSEAEAVEAATDLATARAAAERVTVQCQTCHAGVGMSAE
jgi:hypothetical protein